MRDLYLNDAVAAGDRRFTYRRASPQFLCQRPVPDFLSGPVPQQFAEWFLNDRSAPEVGVYACDDVRLIGNTMMLQGDDLMMLTESGIHLDTVRRARERLSTGPALNRRVFDEEVVVLAGAAYQVYGHWLIDFMPRLSALRVCGYNLGLLRFLLPADLGVFALNWLRLLGIHAEQIEFFHPDRDLCQIGRMVLPSNLRGNGRANPLLRVAAAEIRDIVLPDLPKRGASGRRLFVSRREWGSSVRTLINGEEVEAMARHRGLEVVHPQGLTLRDQLRLFAEAELIVGEYGSGLHHSIFAEPGTRMVLLRGTLGLPGFLQSGLCETCDQPHAYVFGDTDAQGAFQIAPADFNYALDRIGG